MTLDLRQLQQRFEPHSVLALAIEPGRISATVVRSEGGTSLPLFLDVTAEALLQNPAQVGTELAAALETAGIRERRCAICLPPSWALSASADLPEVSPEDLRGYFELHAEREFSTADLRIAFNAYSVPGGGKRATLAALPLGKMEAVETFLQGAGCHMVSLSLALHDSLAHMEPTFHLLVRSDHTDAIVTCGGGVAALRSLPPPSDAAAFAREIRITLGRLPEGGRQAVRRARVTGPHDPGLRAILERAGFESIVEETGGDANPAVECAERFLRKAPVPFEFIVTEPSRWPVILERLNTRRGRQIAAAALALLFLPLLVFTIRSRIESRLNAEWDGMKANVAELDALQHKIHQYRPWFEPAPQKLQALETLIAAFPERGEIWARTLQIANFTEKNGASAQGGALKATVSGFARNSAALQGLQDRLPKQPGVSSLRLQQIRGNNPVQFSLTFRWEPKHE